ncbi:hypothetical protein MYX07_00575 [Patescibacteria group bacterium AH-259-L07]|nr:hypothetical protein [Patescibacteria group bacterium AH-259-L07]
MNDNEKGRTMEDMEKAIKNSNVAAFAIMDYWTFDGYIAFREYLDKYKINLSKAVFPGMELRIEAPVNYRLNIQVILSDKLSKQTLIDFKSKLKVASLSNKVLSDEAIISFAKSLDDSKAKKHGFDSPNNLDDEGICYNWGQRRLRLPRNHSRKLYSLFQKEPHTS